MKHLLSTILFFFTIISACHATDFVSVRAGGFVTPTGTPYYYVGANMWYAPLLADKHMKGGRDRLKQELTTLKEMGVTVLRIELEAAALTATDTLTSRLHYLLREMNRRDLRGIVCLRDIAAADALSALSEFKDEAAIMAWEIAESAKNNRDSLVQYVAAAAKVIKSADANHLVAVSLEDCTGREADARLYERLLSIDAVDFVSVGLWPLQWNWSSRSALYTTLPNVYLKASDYLDRLERTAARYEKPLVIGGFSYPRELNHTEAGTYTLSRDAFFNFVFNRLAESHNKRGNLAGVSFWGWSGKGRPEAGPTADRPNEQQGRYSVYDSDSTTINLVRRYAASVKERAK